jgi:hypothetical protein
MSLHDLAAERAVIGALLTGALSPRDVDADLFGHPHHARLGRALLLAVSAAGRMPRVAVLVLLLPRWRVVPVCLAAGGDVAMPLLDVATGAPKRWDAVAAVVRVRELAALRDDVRRDREALVGVAAAMVDGLLAGYTRQVRADDGVMCRGGEDGAYVRPIDEEAIPSPRTFRREVFARLAIDSPLTERSMGRNG